MVEDLTGIYEALGSISSLGGGGRNHCYILLLHLKLHCLLFYWEGGEKQISRIIQFISTKISDSNMPENRIVQVSNIF